MEEKKNQTGNEEKSNIDTKANKRFYSPHFDVLGSYTGTGVDPYEQPEQDSDDL